MLIAPSPTRDILICTGIGGITLGGGSGPLTGRYGLVIDSLLLARVVVAKGTVLNCSEENSDLSWAIREGGSNFRVVLDFTYHVHNQGEVFHGPLMYTPDKTKTIIRLVDSIQDITE
ncbi:hypothetical protein OCU04_009989 [Sclerotinia nivalis]|uniref:FAD linked oxidase N-terminal domain-containing protein n=1 Tax=Sclerotinia nivalis TaxID=352851 RepID=A0A9X0AEJ4_9HELO|nr:hypothetical protein OCU04_009989 [Sclerotinia nivalis]